MKVEEAHIKFIKRIGLYNGFLFQTATHFTDIVRSQKKYSEEINLPEFNRPILGNRLVYRNPITVKYEFAYDHSIDENNLEESLSNLKVHYFNFVIAQCFEAFETYLKDVVAAYLSSNSNISFHLEPCIDRSNYEKCRETLSQYCRFKNKYNKKLFELLYNIEPKISETESNNFLRFEFKEWNIVFTEIRHSIVHSNGQFKLGKFNNWTQFQKDILYQLFITKSENNIGLVSTVSEYDYVIRILAQHGQIIYDFLEMKRKTADNKSDLS